MQSTFLSSFFASFRTVAVVGEPGARAVSAPIELKPEQLGEVGGGLGPAGTWSLKGGDAGPAGTW